MSYLNNEKKKFWVKTLFIREKKVDDFKKICNEILKIHDGSLVWFNVDSERQSQHVPLNQYKAYVKIEKHGDFVKHFINKGGLGLLTESSRQHVIFGDSYF